MELHQRLLCPSLWGCVLLLSGIDFFESSRLILLPFPGFLCSDVGDFEVCVLTVSGLQIDLHFH